MSTFRVALERLNTVGPHPNANRLETATLEGMTFQFVVPLGRFKPGDLVLYFPLDCVLPAEVIAVLGLTGKLGGSERNQIHTVCLRGFISQGIVEAVAPFIKAGLLPARDYQLGEDVTQALKVVKFEKPPNEVPDAILLDLPSELSEYDIEGADRHADVAALLLEQPVIVMEKLEGCNFGLYQAVGGPLQLLQKTNLIQEKPGSEHPYWATARRKGWVDSVARLRQRFPGVSLTVTGEMIGPGCEGNYYQLPRLTGRMFDLRLNGQFLAKEQALLELANAGFTLAPEIFARGTLAQFLSGRTLREAAHGQSLLKPKLLREGIVIQPSTEQRHPALGRLILKQRDPVYLSKTGQ